MDTTLTPLSPDAPHPTQRDSDGGRMVGGGTRDDRFARAQAGLFTKWNPERLALSEQINKRSQERYAEAVRLKQLAEGSL